MSICISSKMTASLTLDTPGWKLLERCNFYTDNQELYRLFKMPRAKPSVWPLKDVYSPRFHRDALSISPFVTQPGNHWPVERLQVHPIEDRTLLWPSAQALASRLGVVGAPTTQIRMPEPLPASKLSFHAPEFVPKSVQPAHGETQDCLSRFTPLPSRPHPRPRVSHPPPPLNLAAKPRRTFRPLPPPTSGYGESDGFCSNESSPTKRQPEILLRDDRCVYCVRMGYDSDMTSSHCLRHPITQAIICPNLKDRLCPRCGDQGQYSHNERECVNLR